MVILVIHFIGIRTYEAKRHPPIPTDFYSPASLPISFQRMQLQTGQRHVAGAGSGIESSQYQL